jgi:hypothetical protein
LDYDKSWVKNPLAPCGNKLLELENHAKENGAEGYWIHYWIMTGMCQDPDDLQYFYCEFKRLNPTIPDPENHKKRIPNPRYGEWFATQFHLFRGYFKSRWEELAQAQPFSEAYEDGPGRLIVKIGTPEIEPDKLTSPKPPLEYKPIPVQKLEQNNVSGGLFSYLQNRKS